MYMYAKKMFISSQNKMLLIHYYSTLYMLKKILWIIAIYYLFLNMFLLTKFMFTKYVVKHIKASLKYNKYDYYKLM